MDFGNFLHDERCWGVDCGNKTLGSHVFVDTVGCVVAKAVTKLQAAQSEFRALGLSRLYCYGLGSCGASYGSLRNHTILKLSWFFWVFHLDKPW